MILYDVEESEYNEEWYQHHYSCGYCNANFMLDYGNPHFCPNCGHKIQTIRYGQTCISNFKED